MHLFTRGFHAGTRLAIFAVLLFPGAWRLHAQVPQIINYQGRVAVGTASFDGAGQFKFALVNNAGTTSYWSNDGTSVAGSEPTGAVALTVTKSVFSVLLGDTALPNMTSIPASVFNNADVRLRIWFNDGINGSQLLAPDQRVVAVGYAMVAAKVADGATPAGGVIAFAGIAAPSGWLLCDGSVVSRTTYATLFAAIGTAHGTGDGSTTFNLPDYRGRFLRGLDGIAGRDPDKATRTAMAQGGATGGNIGSVQDDSLQNITGMNLSVAGDVFNKVTTPANNGAFYEQLAGSNRSSPGTSGSFTGTVGFDASRVARTSTETRPTNAYVNYIIKY